MKSEVRPTEPSVLAVLSDEHFFSDELNPENLAPLKKMTEAGQLFFMHTDDPSFYRLDVYVDESPPDELDIYFTARSGSFLLQAPTGRLVVRLPADRDASQPPAVFRHGIEVPVGDYVVSVRDREEVNVSAHENRIEEIVGAPAGGFVGYSQFGALGAIVGVPISAIGGWVTGIGVVGAAFFVGITKEHIEQHRRMRTIFGRYWSRNRTKDWLAIVFPFGPVRVLGYLDYLPAALVGAFVGVVGTWITLGPTSMVISEANGAPFQKGDMVQVLNG